MQNSPKKKLRLSQNKMIAGVLAGIAEYFDWDVVLVRIAYAIFLIITGFMPGVLIYLIAWFIMRLAEQENSPR